MVRVCSFGVFTEGSSAGEHVTPRACLPTCQWTPASEPVVPGAAHRELLRAPAPWAGTRSTPRRRDSRRPEETGGRACYLCLDLRLGQILIFPKGIKLVTYYQNKRSSVLFCKGGFFFYYCYCLFLIFALGYSRSVEL